MTRDRATNLRRYSAKKRAEHQQLRQDQLCGKIARDRAGNVRYICELPTGHAGRHGPQQRRRTP